jgi:hypothetical protein
LLYFAFPVETRSGGTAIAVQLGVTATALVALLIALRTQLLRQLDSINAPLGGLVAGIFGGLLLFALLDYAVAVHAPSEFTGLATRVDALYFAIATLLTVGFGDVAAQGQTARGLLCVQMLFNIAVLATTGSVVTRRLAARARARHPR